MPEKMPLNSALAINQRGVKQQGQVESAGKSRQKVGGENPPHGNG